MSYCTECGSKLIEEDRFCPNCGAASVPHSPQHPAIQGSPIEPINAQQPHLTQIIETAPAALGTKSKKWPRIILMIVVAYFAISGVLWSLFKQHGQTASNVGNGNVQLPTTTEDGSSAIRNWQPPVSQKVQSGPSTELRLYSSGDTWTYSLNGSITAPSGTVTTFANGTLNQMIVLLPGANGQVVDRQTSMTIPNATGQSIQINHTESLVQNPKSHDLDLVSDTSGVDRSRRETVGKAVDTVGTWGVGEIENEKIKFSNGDFSLVTIKVLGSDIVTIKAGTFSVWKAHSSVIDSNGDTQEIDFWFAPELGNVIKEEIQSSNWRSEKMDMQMDLVSSNISGAKS